MVFHPYIDKINLSCNNIFLLKLDTFDFGATILIMHSRERICMHKRRGIIKGIVSSSAVMLAGCSGINPTENEFTRLEVRNYTQATYSIEISVVSEGASDRSEGTLYTEEIEVSGNDSENSQYVESEAFRTQKVIISIKILSEARNGAVSHFHFTPDCQNQENTNDGVFINLNRENTQDTLPTISYQQTNCESI